MRTLCANVIASKLFPLYVINKLSQVAESHFGMPLKIQVKLILNLKIKRDLPSRCLIVILSRHQSGTKELHEKHAHAYLVSLKSGSVSRRKSRNEGEGGGGG